MKWKRPTKRVAGAGDLVAIIAQPIARAIDAATGTNLASCRGCAARREALNRALPFDPPPPP